MSIPKPARMIQIILNKFAHAIPKSSNVDNFVFRLYYRWTVLILVTFSFIITCRILLGNSFSCVGFGPPQPSNEAARETYCYDDQVFSLFNKSKEYISKSTDLTSYVYLRYHNYYFWVNLFFLLHAFNFYLPHLLWKSYEGGYTGGLNSGSEFFFLKEERSHLDLHCLAKYILLTEGKHKLYTSMFIFFEVCNYACSLSHTIWLVMFFDVTGVPDYLSLKLITWSDFRDFYFPSAGICEGHLSMINFSTICILPLNNLYMKMFLFLHTWYIFLTILCGVVLMHRIALLVPSFRVYVMNFTGSLADKSLLKSLCYRSSYSDFFFLARLQKVMSDTDFAQMIDKLTIISHCKSVEDNNGDQMSSLFEDINKEFNGSTATSPV